MSRADNSSSELGHIGGCKSTRGVAFKISRTPKPKNAGEKHRRSDHTERGVPRIFSGDATEQRRRERIAQRVDDEDVQRERSRANGGMSHVGENRVGWAGVEEEEKLGEKDGH